MGITIERQLPERGARGAAAAPAGQCCCCCCCCLHTVGGVIGALVAFPAKPAEPQIPLSTIDGPTREPRLSATGLYWATCAILGGLVGAGFVISEGSRLQGLDAMLLVAMTFPGVQLAASIVAALVIVGSKRPGKELRLAHLGKITVRAFIGGVIGALVMLPMCVR